MCRNLVKEENLRIIDPAKVRIVDLSTPYDWQYSSPTYPVAKDLRLYQLSWTFTLPRDGFYMSEYVLGCHIGSHMDTPMHWVRKADYTGKYYALDEVPLEALYGETVCFDIPKGPGAQGIHAEDFEKACKDQNLEVKEGDIVLVHTGWGRYFHDEPKNNYYIYQQCPGLDLDGAEWLVRKKIKGYGQDTMGTQCKDHSFYLTESEKKSGEAYISHIEPVHHKMLENDILLFEHLYNLDKIKGRRVICGFFPLPLVGVEASPIRALAFLED